MEKRIARIVKMAIEKMVEVVPATVFENISSVNVEYDDHVWVVSFKYVNGARMMWNGEDYDEELDSGYDDAIIVDESVRFE